MVENLGNKSMIYSDSTCQWTEKEITVKSQHLLKHWVSLCLPSFFKTIVSGKYMSEILYY